MLNVKDFCTFQCAYDALPEEGGTILVPAGTYSYVSDDNKGQFRGLPHFAAVIEAAGTRLRPILMTTAATVFGHLPLIFVHGTGGGAREGVTNAHVRCDEIL
jgi:hypothetical protein